MPSPTEITVPQLARLIGLPQGPLLVDVRSDESFAADPRLIPGSIRRPAQDPASWASTVSARNTVVICGSGAKLSQGVAAWLRHEGLAAETLKAASRPGARRDTRSCELPSCRRSAT